MANENGKKRGRPRASRDPSRNTDLILFALELALAGGNATAAGRRLGWSGSHARKVAKDHPEIVDHAKAAVRRTAESTLGEWKSWYEEARQTMCDLMLGAEDERVRKDYAQFIIERVEGKAPQPVTPPAFTAEDVAASVLVRFVASLHMGKGVAVHEAMAYAERHPEKVEEWGRRNRLLPQNGSEEGDHGREP